MTDSQITQESYDVVALKAGRSFGEVGLQDGGTRKASIRGSMACTSLLLRVSTCSDHVFKSNVLFFIEGHLLLQMGKHEYNVILRSLHKREHEAKVALVRSLPVLHEASIESIRNLAHFSKERTVEQGVTLCQEGGQCNEIEIITEGYAYMTVKNTIPSVGQGYPKNHRRFHWPSRCMISETPVCTTITLDSCLN